MADGEASAVSFAAIALPQNDLTERILATPTPSELLPPTPRRLNAEKPRRRHVHPSPRPPKHRRPRRRCPLPVRRGRRAAVSNSAARRWSLVQAAIVPSVVVAARRGEEKMFPDGPASWMRTGSGGRPARPPSAALRDAIQPMNLDARLAEDGRFAS